MSRVSYAGIPGMLDILPDDTVLLSSDISRMAYSAMEDGETFDADVFLDSLINRLGGGTLLLPVYNWDFCRGGVFDYGKTRGKTGFLGNAALKRPDFIRTRHPIYSFAVWGKDAEYLYGIDTRSSFGPGTVFDYLYQKRAKNIVIDVHFNNHYTFCHHVEQCLGVPYRYNKYFESVYIDENGAREKRRYMMNVRKLELEVGGDAGALYEEFLKKGAAREEKINDSTIAYIDIFDSYEIIRRDILENNAAMQVQYRGQHDKKAAPEEEAYGICSALFSVNRSISGEGVRKTLAYIKKYHLGELRVMEYPCGRDGGVVFDWNVPPEWNIREAYIENENGVRIADFKDRALHVAGYSEPVDRRMSFAELDGHLYSLENDPDATPYVTSYYKRRWGFCIPHRLREELRRAPEAVYRVKIDSDFNSGGVINYGELIINGYSDEEVLISTYICHPDMANDNLSGIAVATEAAKYVYSLPERRYTYRFIFIPETIGSLIYMKENLENLKKRVKAGFVLSCMGDDGDYSCVHTPYNDTYSDRIASHVLRHTSGPVKEYPFLERGSDERQFCSPGAGLPVVCLCRTKFGVFKEYHTSRDDLNFISKKGLGGGIRFVAKCIDILENDGKYRMKTVGEPCLGKYGLYPTVSMRGSADCTRGLTDVIAYLDGKSSLLDIAEILGRDFPEIYSVAKELKNRGLIEEAGRVAK